MYNIRSQFLRQWTHKRSLFLKFLLGLSNEGLPQLVHQVEVVH